jgi:hypothetical protein
MDTVKIDLCPVCRRSLDYFLENVPADKIFIKGHPDVIAPPSTEATIYLCDSCSKFIFSTLGVAGFTVLTP